MEDFGYSKQQEENAASSLVKRAFLVGATLFSVACFIYVTINAYYYFSQESNANVETIKAEANPLKVAEEIHEDEGEAIKMNNSIYEDIFGNKKYAKEKEIKVMESATPALPPKDQAIVAEGGGRSGAQNTQFVTSQSGNESKNKVAPNKNGQIIVYSDTAPEPDSKVLANAAPSAKKAAPATTQPPASPAELASAIAKPSSATAKKVKVQIAALTSKTAADDYWDKLQHLHPKLFSGLKAFVEQVNLGKRGTFYRLQIGNFFDQVRAEEFCNKYVSQTQKNRADCIVVE